MTHLMGQRELAVQRSGVVQQDVGMHHRPGGIRAAALALVLVHVDPAVVEAVFQNGAVIVAQRRQRVVNGLLGLLVGNVLVHIFQQGGVHIVEMQLVHAQQLLAQTDIAVHFVHVLVDCLDEVLVHGGRDVGRVQRRFKGRVVLPRLGEEFQLLVLGIEKGGSGGLERSQRTVKIFIGALTQHSVAALLQADEGSLGQGMLISLGVHGVGEFQVCIGEGAVNGVGCLRHFARRRQQLFLRGGKGMRLAAAQVGQIAAVTLQLGTVGIELRQLLVGNRHDLRGIKAARRVQCYCNAHKFSGHGLIGGVPGILVRPAHTVAAQQISLGIDLLKDFHVSIQRLAALTQTSREGSQRLLALRQRRQFRFPCFVGGVQVFNRPLVLRRNLIAAGNFFDFFHNEPSCFFLLLYHTIQKNQRRLQRSANYAKVGLGDAYEEKSRSRQSESAAGYNHLGL